MIVVAGTIPIRPEAREEAVRAAVAVVAATKGEEGCIAYDFYADLADPCRFHVFEEWASPEALAAHLQQPHTQAFLASLGRLAAGPPNVKRYVVERTEPL